MEISQKVRRALEEYGLTDYEMRAYVALIQLGSMTANQLSDTANIPYSKIYEVLGSLERKGWVEVQHERPSRFYPRPPVEAVQTTKLRFDSMLKSNEDIILGELQPLYEKKGVRERPDIWIVRGEYNILTKVRETLTKCQKELLIAAPLLSRQLFDFLYPVLLGLKDKGIRIMIMATGRLSRELISMLKQVAEVKVREKMFGGGVVCDTREVVLLLSEEGKSESTLAIWSDHVGLATFAKSYFEFLWQSSNSKA